MKIQRLDVLYIYNVLKSIHGVLRSITPYNSTDSTAIDHRSDSLSVIK